MDTLQNELQSTYPQLRIKLLGINERGQEAGNPGVVNGRDLPWLQDVDANSNGRSDVGGDAWGVFSRDLVILDGTNTKVGVLNLNSNNLADAPAYATLREMLVDAAMQSQKPWRNPGNHLDVDNNGRVIPLDVLLIVNVLNTTGAHKLPPPTPAQSAPPYYDVNGDGLVAPVDALTVINFLNAQSPTGGEGESPVAAERDGESELGLQLVAAVPIDAAGAGAARAMATPAVERVAASRAAAVDRVFAAGESSEVARGRKLPRGPVSPRSEGGPVSLSSEGGPVSPSSGSRASLQPDSLERALQLDEVLVFDLGWQRG